MTREEREWAIEEIENNILPDACDEVAKRALGYAIEALSQPERPKGRWVNGMCCSECGQVDWTKPNYCPNCGSDNRGENE